MAEKKSGSSGDNPFRGALEPIAEQDDTSQLQPFKKSETTRPSPRKAAELRTIAELRLVDRALLDRTPRIAELTVHDLNDLAAEFSGIPTANARVADLTIEDIQDIEAVFVDFKLSAGRDLTASASSLKAGTSVDISCCCCTPCCCCAATDMSHTA